MVPVLFEKKEDCCGCGACINICPQNAIKMQEDECGFIYPQINANLCVGCGACKRVCAFQNEKVENSPLETYASRAKDSKLASQSASGGVFASLALAVLETEGVVFGASFTKDWRVSHIKVEDSSDIIRLQGSKYTQSNTEKTYIETREMLIAGKTVLYSGTPCQIAGLQSFLKKEYSNLLTVDIICHGVPSNRMFREYLQSIENAEKGKVIAFTFRDKSIGWGINGRVDIESKEKKKCKKLWQSASSYLYYFTKGDIYRESCYKCKYACAHRPADLTIGDYWGIEKVHPEYVGSKGWDESQGISVVIANTEKGKKYLAGVTNVIELKNSSFENASIRNSQLRVPSSKGEREYILEKYREGGWNALEKQFEQCIGLRKYSSLIKSLVPQRIKRLLKQI